MTAAPLNRTLARLAELCRSNRVGEKVLVAPSLPLGHQLAEALARGGVAWINLRVETVRSLSSRVVGAELAAAGLTLLSRAQSLALVEQACAQALAGGQYFRELAERPGLHRALAATLADLRAAGVDLARLPAHVLETPAKAADLAAVALAYETLLERHRFVDGAEVVQRALAKLRVAPPAKADALYLIARLPELVGGERELVERLSGGNIEMLPADDFAEWHGAAELVMGLGEENEVREVFRRLLARGAAADQAELLYTDSSTYLPLVYELAREHDVPCTFAQGIAVTATRPGRAALVLLDWLASDCDVEELASGVAAGAFDLAAVAPAGAAGSAATAQALRAARIARGAGRYLPRLAARVQALARPRTRQAEDGEPESAGERAARERRHAAAATAHALAAALLAALPAEQPAGASSLPLAAVAAPLALLVPSLARKTSAVDGVAAAALARLFRELAVLPEQPLSLAEATARLREAVLALHVASENPKPGHLHVAEALGGGASGRPLTFVVGLDDARHPGAGLQDPVLLDGERRRVNTTVAGHLPLLTERPQARTRELAAVVAATRGELTLSYTAVGSSDGRARFPARFYDEVQRRLGGSPDHPAEPQSEAAGRAAAAPEGSDYAPRRGPGLSDGEWWLAQLRGRGTPNFDIAEAVAATRPWLTAGNAAEEARAAAELTHFDGRLRGPAPELDARVSGALVSASQLQALAKCPFSYFLRYVLDVRPPPKPAEPGIWLDPLAYGQLFHELFRAFLAERIAAGEGGAHAVTGNVASERLVRLAEEMLAERREFDPPSGEAAFAAIRARLLGDAAVFLRAEEERAGQFLPRWLEVPFGPQAEPCESALGSADCVELRLPGGALRLRGRIDRIDECRDGGFEVWDYKSGGNYIKEERGLHGGRQVQHAIYAHAAAELLARAGHAGEVLVSGYYFPSRRRQGERVLLPYEPGELVALLSELWELPALGLFPHTPDKDDCAVCDYAELCGSAEIAARRSAVKLATAGAAAGADAALVRYRERFDS